jgi:hypothetical protein
MNYFQAHKLLDETRAGHDHTEADITAALELTGDIDPDICTDGVSWWGSGVERRETGLPAATVLRTGSGFSGVEINDHRTN